MTLSMTPTLIAIAAAYVVMGVLLLAVGLTSRFAWWGEAAVIVITSAAARRCRASPGGPCWRKTARCRRRVITSRPPSPTRQSGRLAHRQQQHAHDHIGSRKSQSALESSTGSSSLPANVPGHSLVALAADVAGELDQRFQPRPCAGHSSTLPLAAVLNRSAVFSSPMRSRAKFS